MQVSQILAAKGERVISIGSMASVGEIATKLRREGIGALIVNADGKEMAGIVSERDIVASIAENGPDALEMTAGHLMNRTVVTCKKDSDIQELMEQMLLGQMRHLPVIDGEKLVGMISINDVVRAVLSELKWMTKVLEDQVAASTAWSTDDD